MYVPEGALSPSETCIVDVKALIAGRFVLPKNTELVSGLYAISSSRKFQAKVKIEIQHCVLLKKKAQSKHLRFIKAHQTQPGASYHFSLQEGGEFFINSDYGGLWQSSFCIEGIVDAEEPADDSDDDTEDGSYSSERESSSSEVGISGSKGASGSEEGTSGSKGGTSGSEGASGSEEGTSGMEGTSGSKGESYDEVGTNRHQYREEMKGDEHFVRTNEDEVKSKRSTAYLHSTLEPSEECILAPNTYASPSTKQATTSLNTQRGGE